MTAESFVVFNLGKQRCGLPVSMVRGVTRQAEHVTPAPLAPFGILGLRQLRGGIATVVGLRHCLEMPVTGEAPMHVLVEHAANLYALAVDDVEGVGTLGAATEHALEPLLNDAWRAAVSDIRRDDAGLVAVLDIGGILQKLITAGEMAA